MKNFTINRNLKFFKLNLFKMQQLKLKFNKQV